MKGAPLLLRLGPLLKAGAALTAVGIFAATIAHADLTQVGALVVRARGWIVLALAPYAVAVLVDVAGWRVLLGGIVKPPIAALVRVRVRCDSFGATLPGGALIAESIAPTWLRRWTPLETGIAAVAGRKCFVGLAEALYILASFAVGFSALSARGPALPWVVLGLGLAMLVLFGGTSLALSSGSVAARIQRLLAAIPIAFVRDRVADGKHGFHSTDAKLTALFQSNRARLASACLLFAGAWTIEAVETWLLLHLVGVRLPFTTVFAFEASVSLLRSIGCFAPGGLGVQDLGYVAALGALGVPDATTTGAAFILLKRSKELVWALVGYATLLVPERAADETERTPALPPQLSRVLGDVRS